MKDTPTYSLRNWSKYQHYKDRRPPWIKLYNDLLDDYDFQQLPDESKYHFVASMLLASRYDNRIPLDPAWLAKAMHLSAERVNVEPLKSGGFITYSEAASELLADCLQDARPEREKRERREEKKQPSSPSVTRSRKALADVDPPGFAEFWQAYPRKVGKGAARRAWAKLNGRHETILPAALAALAWQSRSPEWTREAGQFIPHPATYLNQERWEDRPPEKVLTPVERWILEEQAKGDARGTH